MDMRLAAAVLATLLAGCASHGGRSLVPTQSTEAEVRATMGAPALVVPAEGGGKRLVYPRGPLGVETFMVDMGPDGRVVSIHNALNDETFFHIRPGMTKEEVLRLIGPPGETMAFPRNNTHAWDYRFVDTWGYRSIFSVTFNAQDIVVSKIAQRIEREKGMF
jgi:hypothetical protein